MTDAPIIGVVVCTYNRAALLHDVLETLCEQTLEKASYEVLVVDNNSTDNTRAVAEAFSARHLNVRYLREPRQGLSIARNRGWQETQGEYVAYIDDDCKAPTEWLAVADEIIRRVQPTVFCGPIFPFYRGRKPRWYKDHYSTHLPCDEARILNEQTCCDVSGGNCFFLRSVLQTMGGFETSLGMSGDKVGYGEETALVKRISQTMPHAVMYYDPRLYVRHFIRDETMTLRWLLRSWFAIGRASCYCQPQTESLFSYTGLGYCRETTRTMIALSKMFIRAVLFRERDQYPYFQNYLFQRAASQVSQLGRHYEFRQQVKRAHRLEQTES